jgi:tetratricopeptide (TPR) repeat protein
MENCVRRPRNAPRRAAAGVLAGLDGACYSALSGSSYSICFQEVSKLARTQERITRKALKEDPLLNFMERWGEYLQANINVALGILAGVAVVVLVGVLWTRDARSKAQQGDIGLSAAVMSYAGGDYEKALSLATDLQTKSGGSDAALLGKYIAGVSLLRMGRFPEAEQSLRGYLDAAAKNPFYETAARSALASTLEAEGRYADAATQYQELAAKLPEAMAPNAQMDAARAFRAAGSVEQARAILQKLADSNTQVSRKAKIELAILDNAPVQK